MEINQTQETRLTCLHNNAESREEVFLHRYEKKTINNVQMKQKVGEKLAYKCSICSRFQFICITSTMYK